MGSEKKPKTGHYLIGSSVLWGAGQWAVSWFLLWKETLSRAVAATAGGIMAGWFTALVLGRLAKWGLGPKLMMVIGLVLGVAFSSGAVAGLDFVFNKSIPDVVERVDWESLGKFVISAAAIPAAALGLVTGLYVRSSIPRPQKSKKD
jgi:hypothetical protein